MQIDFTLPALIGLVPAIGVVALFLEHVKKFATWATSRGRKGSPWALAAVVAMVLWVLGLEAAGILQAEVSSDKPLNLAAIVLIGIALGVVVPYGYDGLRKIRLPKQPPTS